MTATEYLRPTLKQLNARLHHFLAQRLSPAREGQLPGLWIELDEVLATLSGKCDDPPDLDHQPLTASLMSSDHVWRMLVKSLGLTSFESDVLLLALSVELDTTYKRVFGYINDDMSQRRPTVGLALDLLGSDDCYLTYRSCFLADGALVRFGLLHEPVHQVDLCTPIQLTESAIELVLSGQVAGPIVDDEVLFDGCPNIIPDRLNIPISFGKNSGSPGAQTRLILASSTNSTGKAVVEALATRDKLTTIRVDLREICRRSEPEAKLIGRDIARETHLCASLVHFIASDEPLLSALFAGNEFADDSVHGIDSRAQAALRAFLRSSKNTAQECSIVVETKLPSAVAANHAFTVPEFQVIDVPSTSFQERQELWRAEIHVQGLDVDPADLEKLSRTFRFDYEKIRGSVLQGTIDGGHLDGVWKAARRYAGATIDGFARKIEPRYGWTDLVASDEVRDQLADILRRFRYREIVIEDWNFGKRLSYGLGLNVVFAGPPGTGKTMAAEVLGNELGLPLYLVDCSTVISKYIGETEKNLERVFHAAELADSILFFDEADALFGKRTEVSDAHDRYANIETAYLLQRLERHEGVVVLATNFLANMDSAFVRRMTQLVHFHQPDEGARKLIWDNIWPKDLPVSDDLMSSIAHLAERCEINGGSIKNIALAAAFGAASEGRAVGTAHVEHAIGREYRKLGRTPPIINWKIHDEQLALVEAQS